MDSVVLLTHIAFGSVALLTAALAFLTEKGPKFHAKVGRIYAFAMIGVGLTAGALWWIGSTDFLLFIAFFSTYMVLVGWRLGQNRKGSVGNIDQALVGLGIIGTLGLLFISVDIAFGDEEASFAIVPLVFSFICGSLTYFQRFSLQSGTAFSLSHWRWDCGLASTYGQRTNSTSRHLHGCGNHFNPFCIRKIKCKEGFGCPLQLIQIDMPFRSRPTLRKEFLRNSKNGQISEKPFLDEIW